MKKIILLFVVAFQFVGMAQNGINYKAIIKDGSGNILQNTAITVQFQILQGVAQINVYTESHSTATDDNGLIIISIDEGSLIDWASDIHFLKVLIDTGDGLVDMGTTPFKAVPYALTAANVTGLEALDEGNGIGWRLVGRDPANYGDIGLNATDLSTSTLVSSAKGALQIYSTAMGKNTTASGNSSTAMGNGTTALGSSSTTMGQNTSAQGVISTAMGYFTKADSYASTAIGSFNIGGGSPNFWVDIDPLFEIGNGDITTRSNALTVLKNGTHIMNSSIDDSPEIILGGTEDTATGDNGILSSDPNYLSSDIFLRSYDAVVIQLDYDNNEAGQFEIKNGAGTEVFEVDEFGNVRVNGTIVHLSDRRLKKDIEDLQYGLTEILQLQPKAYNWKNRGQNFKSIGLIAQEVQGVIKEIVSEKDNKEKTLGISYVELIPILINAIKEQQEIIEKQNVKYLSLSQENSLIEQRLKKLEDFLVNENDDFQATNNKN